MSKETLSNTGEKVVKYHLKRNGKKDCEVVIIKDRNTDKYCYVNLTTWHVCGCRFDTYEEALKDMDIREDVVEYWPVEEFIIYPSK